MEKLCSAFSGVFFLRLWHKTLWKTLILPSSDKCVLIWLFPSVALNSESPVVFWTWRQAELNPSLVTISWTYLAPKLHKSKSLCIHQGALDLLLALPPYRLAQLHTWSMGKMGPLCRVSSWQVCIFLAKRRIWLCRIFSVTGEIQEQLLGNQWFYSNW